MMGKPMKTALYKPNANGPKALEVFLGPVAPAIFQGIREVHRYPRTQRRDLPQLARDRFSDVLLVSASRHTLR